MTPQRLAGALISIIFGTAGVHAQVGVRTTAPSLQSVTSSSPFGVVETEGGGCNSANPNFIVSWTFTSPQGVGVFAGGKQPVAIEQYGQNNLVVFRTDIAGSSKGLRARYRGTIKGAAIAGTVDYYAPGQPNVTQKGIWCGLIASGAASSGPVVQASIHPLPLRIVETEGNTCAPANPNYIVAWTFNSVQGQGKYGPATQPVTLERFDKDSLTVHRLDNVGPTTGLDVVYTGRIVGNHITGIAIYQSGPLKEPQTGIWCGVIGGAASPEPSQQAISNEPQIQVDPSKTTPVCKSKQLRAAMQVVEDQAIRDPNGAMAAMLACGLTGVCPKDLGTARILDSTNGDAPKYTSQDPGSFACQGLFVHKGIEIGVADNTDAASVLTEQQIQDIVGHDPTFIEWFKVNPLANGQFRVTLIPTSIPLSKGYSQQFAYP